MQCESSTLFKVSHISNQLRAHCPLANYGVFQYGSSVIILFRDWNDANVRTQSGFSEDWNALLTTLRQNKACMGISLLFSDVTKLYVGYRQAEAASNIGKRRDTDGAAYFYSKYYLEDMLEHYADTMPLEDTYTHYLDRLMDDNNSVCSNIKLLYYFLCSERNISLTAKHVHMHRNSVIYRIQKIQDILALDLDDPDVRLRLMISFKILEMTGRIPHWETPYGENDTGSSGIVHQE